MSPMMIPAVLTDLCPQAEMDVEAWAEELRVKAQKNLQEDGEVSPVFVCVGPNPVHDGRVLQVLLPLRSAFSGEDAEAVAQNKDIASSVISSVVEQFHAFAGILITEAWALQKSDSKADFCDELREGISNHPERVEILMTTFEAVRPYKHRILSYKIERNAEGAPHAGEVLINETDFSVQEGRFVSFFHHREGDLTN